MEGWGLRTGPLEVENHQEDGITPPRRKWNWNDNLGNLVVRRKERTQTKITAWTEMEETVLVEVESIPDGRKEEGEERDHAGPSDSQVEEENVPEFRKMREEGKLPDGSQEESREEVPRIVPEGMKEGRKQNPVKCKRVRGKLSKKEDKA